MQSNPELHLVSRVHAVAVWSWIVLLAYRHQFGRFEAFTDQRRQGNSRGTRHTKPTMFIPTMKN
jgi:hypothetical protein